VQAWRLVGGAPVVAHGAAATDAPCVIMHTCRHGERTHLHESHRHAGRV